MTLAAWLAKTGTTQQQFSDLSGIPQHLISRYATGKRHPMARNILAIEKATNGQVSLKDWARHAATRAA